MAAFLQGARCAADRVPCDSLSVRCVTFVKRIVFGSPIGFLDEGGVCSVDAGGPRRDRGRCYPNISWHRSRNARALRVSATLRGQATATSMGGRSSSSVTVATSAPAYVIAGMRWLRTA